jgi:hypothetical protein
MKIERSNKFTSMRSRLFRAYFTPSSSLFSLSLALAPLLTCQQAYNKFERRKFFLQSTELVDLSRSTRYFKIFLPATTADKHFGIIGFTEFSFILIARYFPHLSKYN